MSSKPTHTRLLCHRPQGRQRAQWTEVCVVWSHSDGSGFDLVIPPGINLSGRIVCRKRKRAISPASRAPSEFPGGAFAFQPQEALLAWVRERAQERPLVSLFCAFQLGLAAGRWRPRRAKR